MPWCQQRSSSESPVLTTEGHALSIAPPVPQWEQDTDDEGDLIGKGYASTSPPWDRMHAIQISECMHPITMKNKTLASADSPLKDVKSLEGLLVLLRYLERNQTLTCQGAAAVYALPYVFAHSSSDDTRWQAKLAKQSLAA